MRILMLAQFYYPTIGGEEQHVRDLSIELACRGHEVAVVTLWSQGRADFEVDQGVRIYRVRSTLQRASWLYSETERRHALPLPDPEITREMRRIIRLEQPHIVHAHNWMRRSFLPLKQWSNAALVVSLHDYSLLCAKKRLMYHDTPCTGPGLAKCLMCSSRHYGVMKGVPTFLANAAEGSIERRMVDMFLPVSHATAVGNGLLNQQTPYTVIPNFVQNRSEQLVDDPNDYLQLLPRQGYLLFVGDLSHDKGIHILLQAYAGLNDAPPLVLIGRQGPDTPRTFPRNVVFLASWPHQMVIQAWQQCTLALIPSVWNEPFGIVAIEAMDASRPVIASRTGGLVDIVVDGETGLLVPPGDPVVLRQAIKRLLNAPDVCQRMGAAGKQHVAQFHIGNVVPRIEQIYQTLIQQKNAHKLLEQCDEEERSFVV